MEILFEYVIVNKQVYIEENLFQIYKYNIFNWLIKKITTWWIEKIGISLKKKYVQNVNFFKYWKIKCKYFENDFIFRIYFSSSSLSSLLSLISGVSYSKKKKKIIFLDNCENILILCVRSSKNTIHYETEIFGAYSSLIYTVFFYFLPLF